MLAELLPQPVRSAPRDAIAIVGARAHNLRNISLAIPHNQFVVITGVSGSGKSTLAFDLLFAEGQRRFLDSMNAYARQYVEQLARPDVDLITGIPPTVSIEQRNSRGGGKSTVATVTEVYHFLRLLFARLGTAYCPDCQEPVRAQTRDQIARAIARQARRCPRLRILAPIIKNRKGFHSEIPRWAERLGYRWLRADGRITPTSAPLRLDRFREHDVELVVGTLPRGKGGAQDSPHASPDELVDAALRFGKNTLLTLGPDGQITVHSTERACPSCNRSFQPIDPKNFSYNSPHGWCSKCRGFGELFYLPDVDRGANAEAIEESWFEWQEGTREPCPECAGMRLNPIARAVRLACGLPSGAPPPTIDDLSGQSVAQARAFLRRFRFAGDARLIARDILPEILERLRFMEEVGLGYLQLGRAVPTLSGGEAQRIRLAAQLGSNLSGVLYILDEPTIGLHAADNLFLLRALRRLQQRGNSLLVVEHDEATMRSADHIIDLGPGAGSRGGCVVATGTLARLLRNPRSVTGQSLRQARVFPARGARRPAAATAAVPRLTIRGASRNNLRALTAALPLQRFVAVTGVSGSGKSTLIRECLLSALHAALRPRGRRAPSAPAASQLGAIEGYETLHAVYEVDQSPIGRTPRSIPATYVGFFDEIRRLFALVPEARLRGYTASRFSFNSPHGRCAACQGAGIKKLQMNFLPPAYVRCEDCRGTRYNRETLEVLWKGKNIAQVLDLSVAEALDLFDSVPKILRPLQALRDTGLEYLKLGQTSPTLSGGEAQRVKLVAHLLAGLKPIPAASARPPAGAAAPRASSAARANLFVLEEPTIGLHSADVRRLVEVLQRLVDAGHSVIVIEHNLDLIAEADWIIDLGPGAGEAGGSICAQGTPEAVAKAAGSATGRFLNQWLRQSRAAPRP